MQPYHHDAEPQSIPSTPSRSPIFRPHKSHLSLTFKRYSSLFSDHIEDPQMTESLLKTLRVNKKRGIPSGIQSFTIDSAQTDNRLRRGGLKKGSVHLLKEFRNLQSLKMTKVSFKDFSVLRKAFRTFRGLKNLEITFVEASSADKKTSIQDLIKVISPRLKQLKLDFPGYFFPDVRRERDDCQSHLRNLRLDRLNHLKKLSFNFPISSFVQDKGNLRYIDLSPMKRLDRLQSLDITLGDHSPTEDKEIDTTKLYFDPNKLFPNLKQFTWSVSSSVHDLAAKQPELIGPQIASQLKHLDDFGLGSRHARAKVHFIELSQSLATLHTKLNSLHFMYNCGELLEQDAKALFSALSLQRLKSLHTLSLEFLPCKGITNGFLADLAQACADNFTGLRSLRLSFEPFEQDNAKTQSLLKAVFGVEGISDRGIKNFASILSKGCQNLEFVSLEFKKYLQISDSGVKSLCQKFDQLKKLKTVWIKFEDCLDVTETGCEKAGKLLGAQRQVFISEQRRSNF